MADLETRRQQIALEFAAARYGFGGLDAKYHKALSLLPAIPDWSIEQMIARREATEELSAKLIVREAFAMADAFLAEARRE